MVCRRIISSYAFEMEEVHAISIYETRRRKKLQLKIVVFTFKLKSMGIHIFIVRFKQSIQKKLNKNMKKKKTNKQTKLFSDITITQIHIHERFFSIKLNERGTLR